jgi:hypothetical protein
MGHLTYKVFNLHLSKQYETHSHLPQQRITDFYIVKIFYSFILNSTKGIIAVIVNNSEHIKMF